MSKTLELTEQLISQVSVTPADADCQNILIQHLKPMGFECETIVRGPQDFQVTNLWALRTAKPKREHGAPVLVFAGHTDVVPGTTSVLSLIHI